MISMPMRAKTENYNQSKYPRYGGYLILTAALQFILSMAITQYYYPCQNNLCYNIATNPISDLGNTFTSAAWPIFNYSIIIFGALLFAGLLFLKPILSKGTMGCIGFVLLLVSALSAAGVGAVPENTVLAIHSGFALAAFIGSNLGILLVGLGIMKDIWLKGYWLYSALSGLFGLVCIIIFMLPSFGLLPHWMMSGSGIGFGAIERLVLLAPLFWILVIGFHFSFTSRSSR